ncbi:MAG TPA: fumarylacetoacetate hydrolase family protein [Pirellulales bacterium]|nr:fumarylacetoacetate hydrolase family protein [Pirellulales bacterium]
MKLAKFRFANGRDALGIVDGETVSPLDDRSGRSMGLLTEILESDDPVRRAGELRDPRAEPLRLAEVTLVAPIERQEVWAAGVTYKRSKTARMEESQSAATLYDRVYASARPELFFKATPHRVCGPKEPLRIRRDSAWNVPEPELALVLNSRLELVGLTVGNDMSSRDIEGENPLYLPQAKLYDACCGLGPWITLGEPAGDLELDIRLSVRREGRVVFAGATNTRQMARSLSELIGWLGRDNSFPGGAILLTGTGVVPESDFTLHPADVVEISIDTLGTLVNPIVQG